MNEWSYTATPPTCLHGMERDNLPFYLLLVQQYLLLLLMMMKMMACKVQAPRLRQCVWTLCCASPVQSEATRRQSKHTAVFLQATDNRKTTYRRSRISWSKANLSRSQLQLSTTQDHSLPFSRTFRVNAWATQRYLVLDRRTKAPDSNARSWELNACASVR